MLKSYVAISIIAGALSLGHVTKLQAQDRPWGALPPKMDSQPIQNRQSGYQGRYNPWSNITHDGSQTARTAPQYREPADLPPRESGSRHDYEPGQRYNGEYRGPPAEAYYPGGGYGGDYWRQANPYNASPYPYEGYGEPYRNSTESFPFGSWTSPGWPY